MSPGTYLLILATTLCTIGAQIILKSAVTGLKPLLDRGVIDFLLGAAASPAVIAALVLQVLGYVCWLFVLSREQLSVAFAVSGSSFYLLMAVAAWWFHDERLAATQWLGIALISAGVLLVTMTSRNAGAMSG